MTATPLVFVDSRLDNLATLLCHTPPSAQVVVLDKAQDALEQILTTLAEATSAGDLHWVCHGEAGKLYFGETVIDEAALESRAEELTEIGRVLSSSGAAIWLYGCHVAEGAKGQNFVLKLSSATGAKVHAASHAVGASALGASWSFDVLSTPCTAILSHVCTNPVAQAWSGSSWAHVLATSASPVLDAAQSPALAVMAANAAAPTNGSTAGATLVSALIGTTGIANYSDANSDPAGLAITGVNTTNGTLYFSTNAGATWTATGAVSATSARVLMADANTYLYYQPNAGYSGTVSDAITLKAWDQTGGYSNGQAGVDTVQWPVLKGTLDTSGAAWGVAISGNYAYVADGDSGLHVIDISNPAGPTLVGTYDTSGFAAGVAISGNRAYVADSISGLHVIDISTPASPTLVGTYDTSGFASGVAISGNHAYVADLGSGLQVIDISTPASPSLVGTYDTPDLALDVAISGNRAYVADSSSGLQVIDISTPASPTLVGIYDTPNTARGVTISGNHAYVADAESGLQVIDISTPAVPTLVGTYDTSGFAAGVAISGNRAYVADGGSGLRVIDISTPAVPTLVGTYDTTGFARGVAISGNHAYVADFGSGLQIIDIAAPAFSSLSDTASVVVAVGNAAPTISGLPVTPQKVTLGAGDVPLNDFSVDDADANPLVVTLTTTNGTLINVADDDASTPGIQLSGSASSINLVLFNAEFRLDAEGAASVHISVTDGIAPPVTGTYNLTVFPARPLPPPAPIANTAPTFFNGTGKLLVPFDSNFVRGFSLTVQADGKLVVAGQAFGASNFDHGLIRLNTDGSLDTSFDGDGKALIPVGSGNDQASGVIQQTDGKLVVSGVSNSNLSLIRLNANGSLDTGFGAAGSVIEALGGQSSGNSVIQQADGKLVVAGSSSDGTNVDFALVRFNELDGSLDTSFGTGGRLVVPVGSSSDTAYSVIQQADGKLVVAGDSTDESTGSSQPNFSLIRLNANGTLDASFDSDGKVTVPLNTATGAGQGRSVIQQADGKLLVAGYSSVTTNVFSLIRLNTDGSLDSSFGSGGQLRTALSTAPDLAYSVIQQVDGKLVVAGQSNNDFGLMRLLTDGSLDTGFGNGGTLVIPVGTAQDIALSVVQQADGKLVVAGYNVNAGSRMALVRLNTDGSLDPSLNGTQTLGGAVAFIEGGAAVTLDADVQAIDPQLAVLNSGSGNYSGATLTLARSGGANAQDVFGFNSTGALFTVSGSNLQSGGQTFATFTQAGGTLSVNFTSSATTATQALVNDVARHIQYSNSSSTPPASVTLDWTLNDGNTGSQGTGGALSATGSTVVNITAVNDAPTLTGVPGAALGVTTGVAAALANFSVADVDSANLTVTLTASNGTLGGLTGWTVSGAGNNIYSKTDTQANLNTEIAGATFTAVAAGAASIGISVDDGAASAVTGMYNLASVPAPAPPPPPPPPPSEPTPLPSTVVSVTASTADGTYKAGDTVSVQVNFSEAVTVTGTPQLTLETGTTDQVVNYASGTGSGTLTFTYTVQAGDTSTDLDYQSTTALALNSGAIRDAAGNNAILTLAAPGATGSLGANKAIVIDGVPPTATIVVADTVLNAGETSLVTLTFSEAVTGLTNADLTVANGALSAVTSGDGGVTWTATLTPTANITDATNVITLNNAGVADTAGNPGTGTTDSNNYVIGGVSPTVSSVNASTANGTYKVGDTVSVQVNFSAAVTVTGTPQLTLETGTTDRVVNFASGSGTSTLSFTYTVQVGDTSADLDQQSANALSLNGGTIRDVAGNNVILTLAAPGTAGSLGANKAIVIDALPPTVTTFNPADEATGVAAGSNITLTFNEAIARGTGSIVLKTAAGATVETYNAATSTNLSLSGSALTLNPSSDLIVGTAYRVELAEGSIQDLAGNPFAGTTSYNFTTAQSISFGPTDDFVVLQPTTAAIAGAGVGNDTYLLSGSMIPADKAITLSDALGTNTLQLAPGLSVAFSQVAATALRLTLTNGASLTVLGADNFAYDVGGNLSAGLNPADLSFSQFVQTVLGTTVPTTTPGLINNGGALNVGSGPAASLLASTAVGEDFIVAQVRSSSIVGAGSGNDTYLIADSLLPTGTNLTISDALGVNSLQLASGLQIASAQVAATALKLNLASGASITVLGTDRFTFEAGGNTTAGIDQADITYSQFVQNVLGIEIPTTGFNTSAPITIGGDSTSAISVSGNQVVNATAAADVFSFNAVSALADAAGTNTQATISGFSTASDRLVLDLVTANSSLTRLAQLNGQQGISVQTDPVTGNTLINFGNDANGGQPVTLTLLGVSDLAAVQITVM